MAEPDVALPAEESLVYLGDEFINFRNHTYQWVLIKLFELPAHAADHEVLALLTNHFGTAIVTRHRSSKTPRLFTGPIG